MACSHVSSCPLFPKLNATLQIWRDSYCDTSTEWKNCERFKLSGSGRRVPIGLLPNGHLAQALQVRPERVGAPQEPRRVAGAAASTVTLTSPPVAGLASAAPALTPQSWWARLFRRGRPSRADRYAAGRHAVGAKRSAPASTDPSTARVTGAATSNFGDGAAVRKPDVAGVAAEGRA